MNDKQKLDSNIHETGIKLSKIGLKMIQFQAFNSEEGENLSYNELSKIADMQRDSMNTMREGLICAENMMREMRGKPPKPVQPERNLGILPHDLAVR